MQVFVKTLAGETVTLEVTGNSTVQSLKAQLEFSQGVPAESMRVLFQGKNLDDGATLAACEIKEEATVHLVMDLDGGKKKKKKVYDKPKKQKHKNKKIKLRVLNFYKIEGDEIIRNRQECPKCGAGVFMASHRNRYYCGRCHYTSFRTEA